MSKTLRILYSFAAVAVTAFICAYFVNTGKAFFYDQLNLPPLTPKNNVFPVIWSLLYTLMIISYYLILDGRNVLNTQSASLLFLGQLFLQMVWSYLFFYSAYFLYGLIVMILLIWTVWQMIRKFQIINPVAAKLQYPYFLWLLFATYLNAGVVYLNGNQLNL